MGITIECGECGTELSVSFSIDSDGDGTGVVDRCECMDEEKKTEGIENFIDNGGITDEIYEMVTNDPNQFIADYSVLEDAVSEQASEMAEELLEERVEEKKEELAKEVISNIVGKYTLVPHGEPTVEKDAAGRYNVVFPDGVSVDTEITARSVKTAAHAMMYGAGKSTISKIAKGKPLRGG